MALRDLPHQAEPEADTAGLLGMARQPVEGLEDSLTRRLGNPRPVVADLNLDRLNPIDASNTPIGSPP